MPIQDLTLMEASGKVLESFFLNFFTLENFLHILIFIL